MSDVPPDVFPNILSRLPAKFLLRFRCVCKAWCCIIDNPAFIKLHLRHQTEEDQLIFRNSTGTKLYTLSLDSLYNSQTPSKTVKASPLLTSTHNDVPVPSITILSMPSCNGLILVSHKFKNVWMLWNPFTREAYEFELPPYTDTYTSPNQRRGRISIGLGYDSVADDYKVVRIEGYYTIRGRRIGWETCIGWETFVYSLKLKSWRIIKDCPSYVYMLCAHVVFVNGALYWITATREEEEVLILALDLATEDFHFLPLPSVLSKLQGRSLILCALGECLLLTWDDSVYRLDDYGGKNKWTKLFSFSGMGLGNYIRPIAYLKNKGEVLLGDNAKKFIWFNIEKKSAKKVTIDGVPNCWSSQICRASLVRLSNSDGVNGGNAAKGRLGRKKKRSKGSLKLVLTTTDVRNVPNKYN